MLDRLCIRVLPANGTRTDVHRTITAGAPKDPAGKESRRIPSVILALFLRLESFLDLDALDRGEDLARRFARKCLHQCLPGECFRAPWLEVGLLIQVFCSCLESVADQHLRGAAEGFLLLLDRR